MSKHTPGPWHSCVNARDTAFIIKDKGGRIIASPSWNETDDVNFPFREQSEANAKLMAAAPDLAAALHQITIGASVAHDGLAYSEIADIATKALAKAGL